jgi:hypothetical protein
MVRKALSKSNQASSTDGMRSIRKACSLKCFREQLTVMRGHFTADPLWKQAMKQ